MLSDEFQAVEQGEVEQAAPSPSLWQRLRQLFSRDARLHNLNWAISAYPGAPANYILRGELLLKMGDTVGAAADFRRALELAAGEVETQDWGFTAQAMQDRALAGLRDALVRIARYNQHAADGQ